MFACFSKNLLSSPSPQLTLSCMCPVGSASAHSPANGPFFFMSIINQNYSPLYFPALLEFKALNVMQIMAVLMPFM